jgi:hypothetical protein
MGRKPPVITFKLYKNGLYLTEGSFSDPSQARVGFLFQDPSRSDASFDFSSTAWTSPTDQGYFAFFAPSATRDWDSFATGVRQAFAGTQNSQLGWFEEVESAVKAVTLVTIGDQGTAAPYVSTAFSLTFNNVAFQVVGSPFPSNRNNVTFDDSANAFVIDNPNSSTVTLAVKPPNEPQTQIQATANVTLPLDDANILNAASVNTTYSFTPLDLIAFEAGCMYFGPGANQQLTALNYPMFRAAAGASSQNLGISGWLDVLAPLSGERSYFRFTDSKLGSFFTAPNGETFALATTNTDIDTSSRFVFANRPIAAAMDTGTYYLTPAGQFGLLRDDGKTEATAATPVDLLCGVTGTEFLNATLSIDSLLFTAGQPAFQKTTPSNDPKVPPKFLDGMDGNVTTSWVQMVSTTGKYVSQPQESPLYNQDGTNSALLGDAAPASGLTVYLLNFLPLPSWQANTGAVEATAGSVSPMVPMVPYSGLELGTADLADPYLEIESNALNPTRKLTFTNAQATVTANARANGEMVEFLNADALKYAMTPQGMLAGLDAQQVWQATRIALSGALQQNDPDVVLQFTEMGDQIRQALLQNQIFLVMSTLTDPETNEPLFAFAGPDQTINIAGWPFSLSPAGTAATNGTPPIVIQKFYPGQSIADLVNDVSLWSQPDVFNDPNGFTAAQAQAYLQELIQQACESVYSESDCPNGVPSGQPDTKSLYYNFYQVVTDKNFSGLLAVNANMQLDKLPVAIKAVTGGMTKPGADGPESNIAAFRVHHVGVAINDTAEWATPRLAQSSLFGLVDYEKPAADSSALTAGGLAVNYNFEVEYLRALFTNSELNSFSCKINLTINNLFGTDVTLDKESNTELLGQVSGDDSNVVIITGSYQSQGDPDEGDSTGQGVYSFIAEGNFPFTFAENKYLKDITLTKLQFSFDQEVPDDSAGLAATTSTSNIQASFGIWGSMQFNEYKALDIFSFDKLTFNDLGITVSFDLIVPAPPASPSTQDLALTFSPGDLRLDLANSPAKKGDTSLLSLLPFKLKSFLYNQHPAEQTVSDLNYTALRSIPLDPGFTLIDQFNYGLIFDLDLGSLGALVGSLEAFKFSFLVGWLTDDTDGGIAFGVQLPEADGKLEIKIEGVLELAIEYFQLKYVTPTDGSDNMLVVGLNNSYMKVLGQRLPPTGLIDFALFAPTTGAARIGWLAAFNNTGGDGGGDNLLISDASVATTPQLIAPNDQADEGGNGGSGKGGGGSGEGDSKVFELVYLGGGQRVGPSTDDTPINFQDFLDFMTGEFWDDVKANNYSKVYHPDGGWLILTDFKLLEIIEIGFVFYDYTPFYSLTLNVKDLFNFEITYTRISDSIGLFYADFSLPDSLRTFQVGAASLTLPSIGVSVYTNGNWKLDVGFPKNDDWTRSFRVEAMAGPVPVTGSGGFYLASLSSATTDVFTGGVDYPSIIAFGFAARLGVGKDFTAGPLKAGVSVTFFGIIEGAAGYLVSGSIEIFKTPDALSLKGQFGIIGELYGSLDFVIIKASVNVRLQASVGIILAFQRTVANSGEILLYIQASVTVSVKASIDLGLFSITITFSFGASFRFEWKLLDQGQSSNFLETQRFFAALPAVTPTVLPLCDGFTSDVALWYLPEGTVVFPATTGTGTPWLVSSLGLEFDPAPSSPTTYADFKPFEKVAAQMVSWALWNVLGETQPSSTFNVTLDQLNKLDQDPTTLIGWIDYASLLAELAVFTGTQVTVPTGANGATLNGTIFPMPPFMNIKTSGRLDSGNGAADLDFVYSSNNNVTQAYLTTVDEYLNQLFVNQEQSGDNTNAMASDAQTTEPLIQSIFVNYFTGLVRGAVHQLLETMQDADLQTSAINDLIKSAVAAGNFASLSGQMSSSFRGGARLPYTSGLTVPGGTPEQITNPLYALLWQEFPVGNLDATAKKYTVALTNPDASQTWLKSSVTWDLTEDWLSPYAKITADEIQAPTAPQQLPFTDIGAPAFAFQNPVVWTQPDASTVSLRPFPSALTTLQATTTGNIDVLVQSRAAGKAYLPGGTPLAPTSFTWGTRIELRVAQIPGNPPQGGGAAEPLKDVFALSGSSQQDQSLLEQVIRELETDNPIESIQILYQTAADAAGLTSKTINSADVFALRTNTTTVTAPPVTANLEFLATAEPPQVPVGATIAEDSDFLQIIQQSAVTNASGYNLRYVDSAGDSLPTALFNGGPAPLTLLITYKSDGSGNTQASPAQLRPFYNSIALQGAEASLVYYAEPTAAQYYVQQSSVAPGAVGVLLTRSDDAMNVTNHRAATAALGIEQDTNYDRADLLCALVNAGVTDEAKLRQTLAASGGAVSQLNALYSLITYQVQKSNGFVQSNLSAPIQPQQPDSQSMQADGLVVAEDDDSQRSYRVYAPLYRLANANQAQPDGTPPDRYASITDDISIDFYQNDAFGNQIPAQASLAFSAKNYYFDPIIALCQWQGVIPVYDFLAGATAAADSFTVYLRPDASSFEQLTSDGISSALQHWTTIKNQIEGKGVSFYVETNLAVQQDGSMVQVALDATQTAAVASMVNGIVSWLSQSGAPFQVAAVPLTMKVAGAGTVPPVYELSVLFGIQRDPSLISPLLKDGSTITFPSAQNVNSSIASTVGASEAGTGASVSINEFAANFVRAFPALVLSVGLNGAQEPSKSSANQARALLQASGVASDGSGSAQKAPQSLWAVQKTMVDVTIGASTGDGPFYLSPKPLDNALSTGVVPLPALPVTLAPSNWPTEQLFTDVDLDVYNRPFFAAVDNILTAAPAAQAFEQSRTSYDIITLGRRSIADQYSTREVDWLFASDSPFVGTALTEGRTAFGQQMRAALMTAYSVDTLVQYTATWDSLPADIDDLFSLYGVVQPSDGTTLEKGFSLSSAKVLLDSSKSSPFTFLFGVADIQDTASVSLDLQYNVTHVEYFLEPASSVPAGEARPSIWLQLVDPYSGAPPHIGPSQTPVEIPLVFRQFPTTPTVISQQGLQGVSSVSAPGDGSNPLTEAAAWHLQYQYQMQMTAHDQAITKVTYNTNLQAGSNVSALALDDTEPTYTLFEALARFHATYPVLLPVLSDLSNPNWSAALDVLVTLVTNVVTNTTWNPDANFAAGATLQQITDSYTVTDQPATGSQRLITLSWAEKESSFEGATLSIQAIGPDGKPYPSQVAGTGINSITDQYTPVPALVEDWVIHEVEVANLNVLATENALSGLQVVRNLIEMEGPAGKQWTAQNEFVYKTPLVRATQPVTPFVDNSKAIDITMLPPPAGTIPGGGGSLEGYIYTLMYDLLADDDTVTTLTNARLSAGQEASVPRRLKVACGFQYPVSSSSGVTTSNPIAPLYPVALARSFQIDASQTDQLTDFSSLYANAVSTWASGESIEFDQSALKGATFVFDITLYAQLSGLNTPVLRLRNLRLELSKITTS